MIGGPRAVAPRSTWFLPLVAGAAVTSAAVMLYFVEPEGATWLPKCPLHALTGWHCPGCGATRAAHALLHGDAAGALAKNPLLVCGLPIVLLVCLWQRWRVGPDWSLAIPKAWIWGVFVVLLAFTLLRNVPVYPFQLLAPH